MSCKWNRCSVYSKNSYMVSIIWQKLALVLDNKLISSNLCVDPSTLHRVVKQFNECSKKEYPKDCKEKKLTTFVELIILNNYGAESVYLRETQEELGHTYSCAQSINVHESTLSMFLKKSVFTRQKMKIVAAT